MRSRLQSPESLAASSCQLPCCMLHAALHVAAFAYAGRVHNPGELQQEVAQAVARWQ